MLNRVLLPVNRAPFEHARRLNRPPMESCRQTGFMGKAALWRRQTAFLRRCIEENGASGAKYLNAAPIQQQTLQLLRRIDDMIRAALLEKRA